MTQLGQLPRITLGRWPTPLDALKHPILGTILVKRDDLSGFGGARRSGVKARKLEGLLGHAQRRGAERIVTVLGNVTNLGPDLVKAAAGVGITPIVYIVNTPRLQQSERYAAVAEMGASARILGNEFFSGSLRAGWRLVKAWVTDPQAIVTLPSPAHPAAICSVAIGYIEAMRQALETAGILPRAVYIATASGATAAGMILGELLMRESGYPAVEIVPVQVGGYPVSLWIGALVKWASSHLGVMELPRPWYTLVRERANMDYGHALKVHCDICLRIKEWYGLDIDPIYGGKAWFSLEKREGDWGMKSERPVMFWHCGYTPNWKRFVLGNHGALP